MINHSTEKIIYLCNKYYIIFIQKVAGDLRKFKMSNYYQFLVTYYT